MNDDVRDIEMQDDGLVGVHPVLVRALEPMPAEARAAVRERLLSAISAPRLPLGVRLVRAAVAAGAVFSLLGGVSYAAAASMPGDILYPVKRAAEGVLSAVHLSPPPPAHGTDSPGTGGGSSTPKRAAAPAASPKARGGAATPKRGPEPMVHAMPTTTGPAGTVAVPDAPPATPATQPADTGGVPDTPPATPSAGPGGLGGLPDESPTTPTTEPGDDGGSPKAGESDPSTVTPASGTDASGTVAPAE